MFKLTALLCAAMFMALLIGGEDRGQLRPGLAKAAAQARVLSFFICIVCLRLVRMVVTRALSGRAAQTPSVWCSQSIFPGNSSALMVAMISPCSST